MDDILDRLKPFAADQTPVRLYAVYKGLPITSSATVVRADEQLVLQVNPVQAAALHQQRRVYLLVPDFPQTVEAACQEVLFKTGMAVFNHLLYVNVQIQKRANIRVEPKEPVQVFLDNKLRQAQLVDLSYGGMSIRLPASAVTSGLLEPKTEMEMWFKLSDVAKEPVKVEVKGKIMNVVPLAKTTDYRVGLKITPFDQGGNWISKYIGQRQQELVRELKEYFDRFSGQS